MDKEERSVKNKKNRYRFLLNLVIFLTIGVLVVLEIILFYLFLNPSIKTKEERDIIFYTAQIKKNPENPDAYFFLSQTYYKTKDFKKAEEYLKIGIKKFPRDYRFYLLLSYLNLEKNNPNSAEKYARKALSINPELAEAYYLLGKISARKGKLSEAISFYSKAISLDHYNADYYYELGQIYEKKGLKKNALMLYKEALKYTPDVEKIKEAAERLEKSEGE